MSVETEIRSWLSQWSLPSADGDALVAIVQDLLASERAAATAAAVGACVKAIDYTAPGVDPATHEEAIEIDTVRACVASIRALSPEGWVGVRREDAELAVSGLLLMSAKWEFCEEEPLPIAAKAAEDAADRIRAALDAAKEG